MAVLTTKINKLSIAKGVGGNFSAASSIVSRAVIDTSNDVFVEPDYPTTNIQGATITHCTALKFKDAVNGLRYAMVLANGAPVFIQIGTD
jgi:hypothetical protein